MSSRPAVGAAARDELLPGPGGDPGGVERLADDEERRDEDDGRVAEAGERLAEVEDAGEPQRDRDADRDDARAGSGST